MIVPAAAIRSEILQFVQKYQKIDGHFSENDTFTGYEYFGFEGNDGKYCVTYNERGSKSIIFESINFVEALVFLLDKMKRGGIIDVSSLET
ncbi:MAG: hypothetical protein O9308_05240 [Beijerinckiaceae bacterium]|nr:hypothetical protein [Beijerinckiaceae bacterium]